MHLVVDGIIFENNPYGGIARVFNNVLPIMCDMNSALKITLFLRNNRYANLSEHNQISTILLGDVYKLRPWRLWQPYFKTIQNLNLKILTKNSKNKIWLSTYFSRPQFKWRGKEVVWVFDMIHELFPEIMPNSSVVINTKKDSIENADEIYCISNSTALDLEGFYDKSKGKIRVVHLSHDEIFKVRSEGDINTNVPYKFVLYVGKRSSHYKGFNTLFEAYSDWDQKEKIKLVVVGPAWNADEETFIRIAQLSQNVVLHERISDDFLCDLYNQAEAFIYPSLYEGFGIPLLEAMACCCPVIASRIPSTLEVAGEIPIYFEPGNSESLKIALNFLTKRKNVEERITLGMERASEFSWEKTAKIFYTHLKALNAK